MNDADEPAGTPRAHKQKVIQPISDGAGDGLPKKDGEAIAKSIRELAEQAAALALPTETEAQKSGIFTAEFTPEPPVLSPESQIAVSSKLRRRPGAVASGANQAAQLIRQKLSNMYASEPDAREESIEAAHAGAHPSKHQHYMNELHNSGRPLAEIQTAWHNYYVDLPDEEKHTVWQEFYAAHELVSRYESAPKKPKGKKHPSHHSQAPARHSSPRRQGDPRSAADIRSQLLDKVSAGGRLSARHHAQSLLFGLSLGGLVMLILLFGFFNERFVAPFISPSRHVSATPIIIDPNSSSVVGPESKIVIPKINLEIPVVYDAGGTSEKQMQAALEKGVVHYESSPTPGETGNVVIVGHSSNNILNKGKYKFAFVLLKNLDTGDTFMLQYGGKRYIYKVYEKRIVKPTETSVLGPASKPSTITLITCDPPGTSINRLIVVAEQISPDPAANTATGTAVQSSDNIVPGNAPSLWQRIRDSIF